MNEIDYRRLEQIWASEIIEPKGVVPSYALTTLGCLRYVYRHTPTAKELWRTDVVALVEGDWPDSMAVEITENGLRVWPGCGLGSVAWPNE